MDDYDWRAGVIARMGKRGFGFIAADDERGDVFFHIKDCALRNSYSGLQVGDRVEFLLNQFYRGGNRRAACEVRVIGNVFRKHHGHA